MLVMAVAAAGLTAREEILDAESMVMVGNG